MKPHRALASVKGAKGTVPTVPSSTFRADVQSVYRPYTTGSGSSDKTLPHTQKNTLEYTSRHMSVRRGQQTSKLLAMISGQLSANPSIRNTQLKSSAALCVRQLPVITGKEKSPLGILVRSDMTKVSPRVPCGH
jgi:hypothetical protein